MRDQCLLWENYPPPQEAEGDTCYCGECWDVGKRLGERNRLDFWSAAPQEQTMVTLQPNRKLPLRPNLFQILISAFSCPAGSLIKCTVHTNIQANKTQWNPNNNHSFSSLPWQARARAVRSVGDVPWRWRACMWQSRWGRVVEEENSRLEDFVTPLEYYKLQVYKARC